MRLLLDTHSFLWFIGGSERLSFKARQEIENPENQSFLSTASLWEMAIKISLGKLDLLRPFEDLISQQLTLNGIELLEITIGHIAIIANLPFHHRDPFDRLLIAQALFENIPIVSGDSIFDAYQITRIWVIWHFKQITVPANSPGGIDLILLAVNPVYQLMGNHNMPNYCAEIPGVLFGMSSMRAKK